MSRFYRRFESDIKSNVKHQHSKNLTNKHSKNRSKFLGTPFPHLVPPSPEAAERIRSQLERLRSSNNLTLSNFITMREKSYPGMNDGLIYPGDQFALGTSAVEARTAATRLPALSGTVKIVVVLVQFPDKMMTQTNQHFEDLLFSTGDQVPTGSMRQYWQEVTNNAVDMVGEVVGPYTLPRTLVEYANGDSGTGNSFPNSRTMAKDAVIAANPDVDFSQYDNNNDGYVDAFMVIHAGPDAAQTLDPNHIWSHKWVLHNAYNTDGTKIYAYDTVDENAQIGVCAHELGHLLFGFIDLYDTDYSSSGAGKWCLMGAGSWNNGGKTPAHPCGWFKTQQNWVQIITPTTNDEVEIEAVETGHKVYKLWKNGIIDKEYFLVVNRQKTLFDSNLPGSGLLIWHIDEAIPTNSNENHPKVALEQADARRDLENGVNRGDASDPFPGTTNNTCFCYGSDPNSRSYGDLDTLVSLEDIPASASTMKVKINFVENGVPQELPWWHIRRWF